MLEDFNKSISIYLFFLILYLLMSNIIWLISNSSPPDWDPAWYLETSVNIFNLTKESGIEGFVNAYTNSFRIKTPLISVLPQPFYYLFGVGGLTPFLTNLTFVVLLNIYFFKLSNILLKDKVKAFFSCIILATMPIIVWLSREFFVEYFLITLIIIYFYYLIKSDFLRLTKYNIILGIIGGCGILLKILFPLYVAGPTLLVIFKRFKIDNFSFRKLFNDIIKIVLIVLLITFSWFYKNIFYIAHFLYDNSFGKLAQDYSIEGPFINQLQSYYTLIINYNISFYYFLLLLIVLLIFVTDVIIKKKKIDNYKLAFVISWLAPIIIFSIGTNKEIRFTAPLLPPLAIIISIYLSYNNIWKKIGLILIFLFPIYNILYSSYSEIPGRDVYLNNFVITKKDTRHLRPPQKAYWPINEIIDFIYQDSKDKVNTFIAVIPSINKFNHNNFRYYNSTKNYKYLDFGGLPRDNYDSALARLKEAKYVISISKIEGKQVPDYLTRFNNELQDMIDSNNTYSLIRTFSLPDRSFSLIYKKN